jgi:predicted metal-dependent hydrolase
MTTLPIDDLSLEVRWSARRRTVELRVERDGTLAIRAPVGTKRSVLERIVREKRGWLLEKLAQRRLLQSELVVKEYVSGEGFAYLGRRYPLLLVDDQDESLKLERGRFRLRRRDVDRGREQFVAWYIARGGPWIARRIGPLAARVGARPSEVIVRDLGRRWGSCTHGSGRIRIHWAMMLMPPGIVDYVLVHELVHLIEPNHSSAFWLRVERAMPDFRRRKQWLVEHGAERIVL